MEFSSKAATKDRYCTLSWLFVFLIFLVDRITKLYALHHFSSGYPLNNYLYLQLVFNRGISWGMFNYDSKLSFWIITSIIIGITTIFGFYTSKRLKNGLDSLPELLVLIGSLSNCIDRLQYGAVIDFIGLQYNDWYFPVFNIADSAIVLGIGLLFLRQILYEK